MDKIRIEKAVFYGYHGVYPEEKKLGQKFIVNIELAGDFQEAAREDNLDKAVDYVGVYQTAKKIIEEEKFNLLEALALMLCEEILKKFKNVNTVTISIKKPGVSLPGILSGTSVEMTRNRANDLAH